MRDSQSMLTRLITTDTRLKYLSSPIHCCSVSLIAPVSSSRVSSTLDNSLGKSCLVDGNPETCWTSQQARITSQSVPLHLRHNHPGPSTIHPTSLFISCHSQTYFANFPRRIRWRCLRRDHPISRCHQLARTHTDLPRGRESCTGVRSHRRRASEQYQANF